MRGVLGDDFCRRSRTVLAGDVSSSWSWVVLGDDFELLRLPLRIRISSEANGLLFLLRRVDFPLSELKLSERAELDGVSSHEIVPKFSLCHHW